MQFFVPNEETRLPFTVSSQIPSLAEVTPNVLRVRDPLEPVIVRGRLSILNEVSIHVLFGRHPVLEVNDLSRVLILVVVPLLFTGLIGVRRLLSCCLSDVFIIILTFISPTG